MPIDPTARPSRHRRFEEEPCVYDRFMLDAQGFSEREHIFLWRSVVLIPAIHLQAGWRGARQEATARVIDNSTKKLDLA